MDGDACMQHPTPSTPAPTPTPTNPTKRNHSPSNTFRHTTPPPKTTTNSWAHLSANLFNLCVFGKLVEELEGGVGVIFTYLVCAVGAAAFSFFL
jgi:hypothetical protein